MTSSELLRALLGGGMIGAAATLLWRANGRVAGVSGLVRGALLGRGDRAVPLLFLAGLVVAGVLGGAAAAPAAAGPRLPVLALAGLLVGIGTRVGGGCTSGHGVCGISRGSLRSLVATATFIATGALTVFAVSHGIPSWGPP